MCFTNRWHKDTEDNVQEFLDAVNALVAKYQNEVIVNAHSKTFELLSIELLDLWGKGNEAGIDVSSLEALIQAANRRGLKGEEFVELAVQLHAAAELTVVAA